MASSRLLGAMELGGTKIICSTGYGDGSVKSSVRFSTSNPEAVIPEISDFFKDAKIESLGIGTFGPVNLDKDSEDYGSIMKCVKPGWSDYPLLNTLKKELNVPIAIDTDVNASCIGECVYGIGRGKESVVYITVGTGIGVGMVVNGIPVHGLMHPEGGHIKVTKHPKDGMDSICPFHADCAEGFACGPAIEKRWNSKAETLENDHDAWDMEAYYLSQMVTDIILMISPEIIIMGGGVMKQRDLFGRIGDYVFENMNGYIGKLTREKLETYIIPESLNGKQAIMGCLHMAGKESDDD